METKYPININKFISQSGLCSRRQADVLIKSNKVKINGKIARPIDKVSSARDIIVVNNKPISHQPPIKKYLAFHKPVGVITTTDKDSPNNIIDHIKYPTRIFPVGRLDVNTSGLILLTNDGDIVNKILKGQNKVEKEYEVEVDRNISEIFLQKLKRGVSIDGHKTMPAEAKKFSSKKFRLVIVEGKKRQVRRMCEKLGYQVKKLKRVRIGNLKVDNIPEGKFVELDYKTLKKLLGSA